MKDKKSGSGGAASRSSELVYLSLDEVVKAGGDDMSLAIDDLSQGFRNLEGGAAICPPKLTIRGIGEEHQNGLVNVLAGYLHSDDTNSGVVGVKIIGSAPRNRRQGFPRASGLLLLLDDKTKRPLCVMEAQVLSAMRTGAVSALAAQKLAPPQLTRISLIGAGVNMRTQLLGLQMALPMLREVRVWSRRGSRFPFSRQMSRRTGLSITPFEDVRQAVKGCEMVVSCLGSMPNPVVPASAIREGGVTLFNIGGLEFDPELLPGMDRVFADDWEQAKKRANQSHAVAFSQGLIAESDVENIGPVLTSRAPGRQHPEERIFFCPTGLALGDILIGLRVYREALRLGLGSRLPLWTNSRWI
jgi:ornithine cyclodeaminase/alanine dehydrogenase-like protein (mu-crystallin family)